MKPNRYEQDIFLTTDAEREPLSMNTQEIVFMFGLGLQI